MITPQKIESRLYELSKEIDESHNELVEAESSYYTKKAKYEIELAKSRLRYAHPDMKMTASQREDNALIDCAELHYEMAIIEAVVKSARANASRIKTQVDITRSIGTSVRTEFTNT